MAHVFNAKKMAKLDDPRRRELIPTEKIFSLINLQQGQQVLDLGCGIGFLTLPAAKVVGSEGFVFGMDIQEAMLVEGLARSSRLGIKQIAWVLTPPDQISLPTGSVDCVLLGLVAHEVPDQENMLQECFRVLRPNGHLGIVEWNTTFTEMGPPMEHRLRPEILLSKISNQGYAEVCSEDISKGCYLAMGKKSV